MTVCRGYVRVSTDEQAEEGYSLEAQTGSIRAYAQDRGWTLAGIYADEGISGKDLKRPALQRLLRDLQRDEILLAWRLDRLTRSVLDSETIHKALDKRGAQFVSISEPHLSTAGPGGTMVRQLTAVFAEYYRAQLGENVRHGMAQMARQGRWTGGPLPYGYDYTEGLLTPNQDADTVRWIFDRYVSGYGTRAIAVSLNERGIRTGRGALWTASTVSYVIRQPLYCGKVGFGRKGRHSWSGRVVVADGQQEALISAEQWEQAQAALQHRKGLPSRSAGGDYPLTGVARCALCGSAVGGARYRDRIHRESRRMYRCSRRQHSGSVACALPIMRADLVEEQWLRAVERYQDAAVVSALVEQLAPSPEESGQVDDLRRQVAEIDRRLMRWDAAYEAGSMDLAEFAGKAKPLRERRRGLVAMLERLEQPAPLISGDRLRALAGSIRGQWAQATAAERKALVHGLCESVAVGPGYALDLVIRTR